MLILNACEDPSVLRIISLIKAIMDILFIVVPIGLIVMLSIDGFKAVMAADESSQKKIFSKALTRFAGAVLLFFVPLVVNVVINIIDGSKTISDNITSCWTRANPDDIAKYQIEKDRKDCLRKNGTWDSSTNKCSYNNGPNPDPDPNPATATIFVGDSRTVGMCNAVSLKTDEQCKAEVSMGLDWFKGTAKPYVDGILSSNPNTKYNIIINLGVNDLGNKSNYVSTYNNLVSAWSKHNIIIVSVTPVDEVKEKSYGYTVKNATIEDFNSTVKSGINSPIKYCNIYSSITYSTSDGVHYDNSTYQKIYAAINNCK